MPIRFACFSTKFVISLVAVGLLAASVVASGVYASLQARETRLQIARDLTGGDPKRAPALLRRYGCAGCHTISGVPGADGLTGPTLEDLRQRVYIGGVANNTAENLVRWIVAPPQLSPRTAMPVTGVSEAEARDIAAYLYAQ